MIVATGPRVISAVDQILRHTQPDDLDTRIIDAHPDQASISPASPAAQTPAWEMIHTAVIPAPERDILIGHNKQLQPGDCCMSR